MSRPEHLMPPECYYNEDEAVKYTNCTRIINVQAEMAQRCMELIGISKEEGDKAKAEESLFILDLGCGSGLSGEVISDNGHYWWGVDIIPSMLDVALQRDSEGELMQGDMGQGFNFTPGFFDAAISVSALQWLCNADKKSHNPWKRLIAFFESLHKSLKLGGKAALQFYPENSEQMEMISNAAIKSGFAGGIYVDYPESASARKYYLVLNTAVEGKLGVVVQTGKTDEEVCDKAKKRIKKRRSKNGKFDFKSKFWVYQKKERQRRQGKEVRLDTKYTGRKRKPKF